MKKYLLITGTMLVVLLVVSWGWSRGSARLTAWYDRLDATRAANYERDVEPMAWQKASAGTEAVTWANVTNCTLTGRTLRKTRGNNELCDAGANSTQTIGTTGSSKVNGFVEFRALESNKNRYLGLTHDFAGTSTATIDFAIHLGSVPYRGASVAEVRENDVYKAEVGYQPSDIFRIAVENGLVHYYHNDELFYSSQAKPVFPLVADCSMLQVGATLAEVMIATNGVKTPSAQPLTPSGTDSQPAVMANMPPMIARDAAGGPGLLDKNQVLIPASYTAFPPPPVGGKYVDSVFGTTVTRLSDGWQTFKDGVHHEYATMSPFNLDNTMIFLQGDNTGFFIVDRTGKIITRMEFSNSAEPRWSHTARDEFYYHEENRLMKYNVTARRATTLVTFNQYERITFGGGECDVSEDGDHLVVAGDMRHVGLFQLSTGKMKRVIDLTALKPWAEAYITANNNIAVRFDEDGEGKYQGLSLFDSNMNFIRKVLPFGAHSDQTRDVNGDEVIVMGAYRDLKPPPGCENNGVMKVRLSDSKKTCILPMDWGQELHVSANTNGKHRWVLVSGTDVKGTADLPNKMQPDWQKKWRPRVNELILVKTDGSERRRIVHHRGRVSDFYWWQPRATLSKDGKFAIFDSNFGFSPIKDYTDSFLVNLTNQR